MNRDELLFRGFSLVILVMFLLAIFLPYVLMEDPYASNIPNAFLPPSADHWFGTDKLGRDLFTRVAYGARLSITMALTVVIAVSVLGSFLGILSGYFGGKVDTVIMRLADIFLAFPGIVLAIAIAGMMGGSALNAILALLAVGWTKYARLARSVTLKLREQDYIAAAVTGGTRPLQIFTRHIAPNIMPIILVTGAVDIGAMMMELAGLSFLGFGAQPPTPEWGLMLNEGRQSLQTAPWLMIFPGAAIVSVVAAFNLWGDALRDRLDPRRRDA